MRRFFCPLALLFAVAALMASCLNSDTTEYVYSDDVAITTFSIASAEITVHTTASNGEDSTYVSTNSTLSAYKFVIDQAKAEIYNVDSLPCNVNPAKILVNCTTKSNGVALLRTLEKPDSLTYVSSTDTIDFTQPRTVCVYSASGLYSREYTIKVNVHKQDGDEMNWQRVTTDAALGELADMRGFQLGNSLVVLGVKDGQTMVYGTAYDNATAWNLLTTLSENASLNAVVRNDSLFVLDGTDVKVSVDGTGFTTVAGNVPLARLVAQCSSALYGITAEGALSSSEDGGKTWVADETDRGTVLPVRDITSCTVSYPSMPNTECVVLAGNRDMEAFPSDTAAVIVNKIVENIPGARKNPWSGIVVNSTKYVTLPRMENLTLLAYDGKALALGGKGIGECTESPFAAFYRSIDFGFTWAKAKDVVFPNDFISPESAFTAFADKNNYLWIVCGSTGDVWKGRLNRMGWAD